MYINEKVVAHAKNKSLMSDIILAIILQNPEENSKSTTCHKLGTSWMHSMGIRSTCEHIIGKGFTTNCYNVVSSFPSYESIKQTLYRDL